MSYDDFIKSKSHYGQRSGFDPIWVPDFLFDFQRDLVEWAVRSGRCAIFADCGMGKTPMQLVWSENVVRKTNGRVLILTPLAVAHQTVREAERFGIDAEYSRGGKFSKKIVVTNYQRLHHFNPLHFEAVVCDESSILKNFDGKTKLAVTEFMKKLKYRLLCTATAAPNDYIELGTSSEALGHMGFMDMLSMFFKNTNRTCDAKSRLWGSQPQWRFKRHAEQHFWRWVCSWARAVRSPSDMGYENGPFVLPRLVERETVIECSRPLDGKLFIEPAMSLYEQRQERRITINERCESVAGMVNRNNFAVVWCHLNDEGDLLEKLIKDAKQVKGAQSDDVKEEILSAFSNKEVRVLITKPKIGAFGLNWQHCNHMTFFPSHSYEQYYQGVRRCWRFGQNRPVTVDIVTTLGEMAVLKNLQRKAEQCDRMFSQLVGFMNQSLSIESRDNHSKKEMFPTWL